VFVRGLLSDVDYKDSIKGKKKQEKGKKSEVTGQYFRLEKKKGTKDPDAGAQDDRREERDSKGEYDLRQCHA